MTKITVLSPTTDEQAWKDYRDMQHRELRHDVLERLREQLVRYASNGTIGRLIRDAIDVIERS